MNQKKLEKQERLLQKKRILEEIRRKIKECSLENESCQKFEVHTSPKKGSVEWALRVLESNGEMDRDLLKKNYLSLAQKYHPDKNEGQSLLEMKELNEAWDIVKTVCR